MRVSRWPFSSGAWLWLPASLLPWAAVHAQESVDYCIRCMAPDVVYVCRVHGNSSSASGQQLFCIMSLAQQYQHESCAASSQAGACTGQLVELAAPELPAAAAEGVEPPAEATASGAAAAPAAAGPAEAEPKTLVEFSKQTAKATADGIKSVGEGADSAIRNTGEKINTLAQNVSSGLQNVGTGIKNATTKTIKCVSTLFTNCSE
jgi:hypothetical protein